MAQDQNGLKPAAMKAHPTCYVPALALLAAVTVLQGGYYSEPAAVVAMLLVLAVMWMVFGMWRRPAKTGLLPLGLLLLTVLLMLLSTIVGGVSYSKLSGLASWSVLPIGLLVGLMVSDAEKVALFRGIAWLGVGCAAVTLFAYVGVLPLEGFVNAARVQSFFQYANTAGIWFAAVALLALASEDRALVAASPLMIVCLFLTQSGGAILAAVIGWVLFSMFAVRADEVKLVLRLGTAIVGSAISFAFALLLSPVAALPILAACVIALYWLASTWEDKRSYAKVPPAWLVAIIPAVAIALVALAASVVPERIARATQTFVERFIQMADGLRALAGSPVLGLGPDQWQYVYFREQSAQYTANVIHNGYLQAALDGGLIAGALLVAGLVIAWTRSLKYVTGSFHTHLEDSERGDRGFRELTNMQISALCASLALLVHAFLDIDLRFASVLLLLGLLQGACCREPKVTGAHETIGLRLVACASVVTGLVAVVSLFASLSSSSIAASLVAGDANALTGFKSDALAADDHSLQVAFLVGSANVGRYDDAVAFSQEKGLPSTGEQALALADNYFGAGATARAESVLLEELGREPYNYQLFERAAQLLREHKASSDAIARFNELADNSNGLLRMGMAALLRNSHSVEEIE